MSKKQFNLDDLYGVPRTTVDDQESSEQSAGRKKPGRKKKDVITTAHTFRIEDNIWDEFVVYVQMRGGNQNAVVNNILRDIIKDNREKIDKFKELMD